MIWLTFRMNPLKTKWLPQPFKKRWPPKKLVGTITYGLCLDCIQICNCCSLGISDDLITFGMNPLKTKWLPQSFAKRWQPKNLWGCSLGISDDLITFGMNPLKTKWLPQSFKKGGRQKTCGHDNFSRYFWWSDYFWDESIKNKMAAAVIWKKVAAKKLVGTITYERWLGLQSNLVWLFARYFWWSDELLGWIH